MVDPGIKKAIIKMDNLPAVAPDNTISLRYRIISDDKNRASHWSPIKTVSALEPMQVQGAASVSNNVVSVVWTDASGQPDREAYDIFVKWDSGNWFYHGTSYVHSFSFMNQATDTISISVQLESFDKKISPALEIFQTDVVL
jgi:hypothetical protein